MTKVIKNNQTQDNPYLRIGTNFYKVTRQPLASKDDVKVIRHWSINNIKQDHPGSWQKMLNNLPKYDGFCFVPDNINYQREFSNHYNQYEPLPHKPEKGNFPTVIKLLKHIFGEQYETGLDYLQLIYHRPTQVLPILCLVSSERETGKTTFLNFLKQIYDENMTINSTEDFRNQFNSGWISKLIIGCEEVLMDKKEDQEKIKNLSTSKSAKSEGKGVDKVEVEFYGKFILCSNHETSFIKIDQQETRYWIRQIRKPDFDDPHLLVKTKKEIPAFLDFLLHRQLTVSEPKSRMWFLPEHIYTEALDRLKKANKTTVENNIQIMLNELHDNASTDNLTELQYTQKDLRLFYRDFTGKYIEPSLIKELLHDTWKLEPSKPKEYWRVGQDGHPEKFKGRYYTIDESFYKP